MRFRPRKPVLSKPVLTLLGTFLILTVVAASDALAADTWSTTGSMTVARFGYTATLLTDAVGTDLSVYSVLASAELYNPTTGTWSATGSMNVGRVFHTATRLLDGRVLVAGGDSSGTGAELYDPTTGTWSRTGSTSFGGFGQLTLLMDGRVLATGYGPNGTSAQLYQSGELGEKRTISRRMTSIARLLFVRR